MTDNQVQEIIESELASPTLAVTEQYLEIHQPVRENGKLLISKIIWEELDAKNLIIAYLPVKDEYFSFAVYIDALKQEIFNIGTEPRNLVLLRVTSDSLPTSEMKRYLKVPITKTWEKGQLYPNGKRKYLENGIECELDPQPDELENKLANLLEALSEDTKSLIELTHLANVYIQAIVDYHYGNQLLGSIVLKKKTLKQLADLNLEISFDLAAWGNPFR